MGVVSFTPRPLYSQGKSLQYPLDRRLGGPKSRSGHGVEEKNFQPYRDSNPDHLNVHPVASLYTDWAIPALSVVHILKVTKWEVRIGPPKAVEFVFHSSLIPHKKLRQNVPLLRLHGTVLFSAPGQGTVTEFVFATPFTPVLGPTQPLVRWVLGLKWPEREVDHSPLSSAGIKKSWSCTFTSSKRLYGMALS
jgi:hypothetical protein